MKRFAPTLTLLFALALPFIARAQSQDPVTQLNDAAMGPVVWGIGTADCATVSSDSACTQNQLTNVYNLSNDLSGIETSPNIGVVETKIGDVTKYAGTEPVVLAGQASDAARKLVNDYIPEAISGAAGIVNQQAGTCTKQPGSLLTDNWLTPGPNCGGELGNYYIPTAEGIPNGDVCSTSWPQSGNCPALQAGVGIYDSVNNDVIGSALSNADCDVNNFVVVPSIGGAYSANCQNPGITTPWDQDVEGAALTVVGTQGIVAQALSDFGQNKLANWEGYLGDLAAGDEASLVADSISVAGLTTGATTQMYNDWYAFANDLANNGVPSAERDLNQFNNDTLGFADGVNTFAQTAITTLQADLPALTQALLPPGSPDPNGIDQPLLSAVEGLETYSLAVANDFTILAGKLDADAKDLIYNPGDAVTMVNDTSTWVQDDYLPQVLGGLEQAVVGACGIVGQAQTCQSLLPQGTADVANPLPKAEITVTAPAGLLQ